MLLSKEAARRLLSLLLVPIVLAGCATLSPLKPEEAVRQRAQARWDALIAADWSKAYRYMAPSYRALVEEKRYANQFGGGAGWVAAEVVNVTCGEDRCAARMKVTARPILGARSGEPVSTHFNETWIREEGEWWLFEKL